MEIPKLPPTPADPTAGTPARAAQTPLRERAAQAPPAANVPADGSGIKPLDLASALKILLTEVKLALIDAMRTPLPDLNEPLPQVAPAAAPEDAAPQAARAMVELLLRLVPEEEMHADALNQAVAVMRRALEAGSQNAIDRVSAWRGTPASIADALQQARALALVVVSDEAASDILMRPEWLGLAPGIARLRRRLRRRRVLLTDLDADHVEPDMKSDPQERGR
jgi:hypothetical protein